MKTISEVLQEAEDIINYNMETLHKLAEMGNTICKDNPAEQAALAKSMAAIWSYLYPVHKWIRDQNQTQASFYDQLDKYLEEDKKRGLNVKDLSIADKVVAVPRKKGKK